MKEGFRGEYSPAVTEGIGGEVQNLHPLRGESLGDFI
jgi:hypothetical protein